MRYSDKISQHLTYGECVKSHTALVNNIDNTPPSEVLVNMVAWANKIFEPVRSYFKVPIGLNSMYRSPELNRMVGGSPKSQHLLGQAGDIDADIYGRITNQEIFEFIRDNLVFDQLIIYNSYENPDFVHCSYSKDHNRGDVLFKDSHGYTKIS